MARTTAKSSEQAFREAISIMAPGTPIREAIAMILQARTGALICIGPTKRLHNLSEGGVQLDSACTPQLLYELSKMDGAILMNQDGSRILAANRFLKPDNRIVSKETGTRHRNAERMAAQAKCMVIAVSERRSTVTLYVRDRRHILDSIATVLNKSTQALQTLEKYIAVLNDAMVDLSTREFQDMVTIFDVCKAVQRTEMVVRISNELDPYIAELGTEGRLVALQRDELIMPVKEAKLVIRDYYREKGKLTPEQVEQELAELTQDELLDLGHISQILGYSHNLRRVDTYLSPRGYRILTQTHRLPEPIIASLVERFGTLQMIMRAPKEELCEVDGVGEVLAERIRSGLNLLQNQLALDRR